MPEQYIFIDESGGPQFFAKKNRPLWLEEGFSPIMLIGMIKTENKKILRDQVLAFQNSVLNDPLLNTIYSVAQPGWFLHAKSDHSDIILKTIEFLREIDSFECHVVIGRKIPELFIHKHNSNANEFYFDLLSKLLELDDLTPENNYHLYLSQRQSNTDQRFSDAFKKALVAKSKKVGGFRYACSVVRSKDSPEMSVIDYLLWTLQRYILKGEKRYFEAVKHHFSSMLDIYDQDEIGNGKLYNRSNPFD
ncbi:MAG: DUF3800 domain-containing protein, partial [Saprospiraceae bacterium]|nr:DUF3800 domain-containing protein [Saprospiraceae bacterium]